MASRYKIKDQYESYFLTFTVVGWVDIFTRQECKDIVIDSLKYCQSHKGLILNAFVIMPSHIHLIARCKSSKEGLSSIIRDFKKYTSKQLLNFLLKSNKESRRKWLKVVFTYHAKYNSNNSKYQLWQQNNRSKHLIYPRFTLRKLNYIHWNPVKDGIVLKPEDYLYSSARNYTSFENCLLDVECIDYGIDIGFIMM